MYLINKTRKFTKKLAQHRESREVSLSSLLSRSTSFSRKLWVMSISLWPTLAEPNIHVTKQEMKSKICPLLRLICNRFMGNFSGFVDMIVNHVPSSLDASSQCCSAIRMEISLCTALKCIHRRIATSFLCSVVR